MRNTFSTRLRRRRRFRQKTLSNAALFLIVLIPIYPVFGSYMQNYTGVIVRWQYDSSTILASYDWSTGEDVSSAEEDSPPETTLIVSEPDIPIILPESPQNTPPPDPKRSLYVVHVVKSGDTLSSIAQKYTIPIATLRTMNNLSSDILSINQKITIPRINGIQYVVKKGDSLSQIAKKYGISDINTILIANDMIWRSSLSIGKKLLLPNPTKDPDKKPVQIVSAKTPDIKKPNISKPSPQKVAPAPVKQDPKTISYGGYTLSLKIPNWCRSFAWWNCTCFVAKYKNVTWRGNAKDWLKNAKKQGIPTGNDPRPGAIIVYYGPGFPPAYGHVGIVMEVNEDDMIIKDMNYRALNEVTTRRESFSNPAIIGYIYVD